MDLTIIVCHMRERRSLLTRCLYYLENQTCDKARVLVMHSDQPKGDKLNFAFNNVVDTSHVMVVDDDDWVSPLLVERVIDHDEDWVGFDSVLMANGRFAQIRSEGVASHICPLSTELAVSEPFGNEYMADLTWSLAIAPKVETRAYLPEQLYFYDKWNSGDGEWSPPRQVGMWPYDPMRFGWG